MRAFLTTGLVFCSIAGHAWALESFSLDPVVMQQGDTKLTITRVEFTDTNLSRAEAATLFSNGARSQKTSLIEKLEAARIHIPELRVESKSGGLVARDLNVSGVKQGRFAAFQTAGGDGTFVSGNTPGGKIRIGALRVEDGDFAQVLQSIEGAPVPRSAWRFGKIEFAGLDFAVPDNAPGSTGDMLYRVHLDGLSASNTYQVDIPLRSRFAMKNLSVTPPKGSTMQRDLEDFGYKSIGFSATAEGVYDPGKKTYLLDDFTLRSPDAASLEFKGSFAAVEPDALLGRGPQRFVRMLNTEIARFSLRFANSGLIEKAIDYYGRKQNRTPEQVKREFAALITSMGPMLMGGHPASLSLAQAVADFVRNPASLSVSLTARGQPVRLQDVRDMQDPGALLKFFDLEAVANR